MDYIRLIRNCGNYNDEPVSFTNRYLVDEERALQIREYFKKNAGLDLDLVAASDQSTWEKTLRLARFVSEAIPHDNQKEWLEEKNAITLWEYSRRVPTGCNCRWHAILLCELLLSIGIRNRFITCLPQDRNDADCHVVNLVWLPELKKWAMMDSDLREYVTDADGVPLSLEEMRKEIAAGGKLHIEIEGNRFSAREIRNYWAKNLYWFAAHTTCAFDLEGKRSVPDSYVALVPPGYDCSHAFEGDEITSNAVAFWGMT